jgi:hypothetical protein
LSSEFGCRLPTETDSHGTHDQEAKCRRNQGRANPAATCRRTESGGDETTPGRSEKGCDHAAASRGRTQGSLDKETESGGSQGCRGPQARGFGANI